MKLSIPEEGIDDGYFNDERLKEMLRDDEMQARNGLLVYELRFSCCFFLSFEKFGNPELIVSCDRAESLHYSFYRLNQEKGCTKVEEATGVAPPLDFAAGKVCRWSPPYRPLRQRYHIICVSGLVSTSSTMSPPPTREAEYGVSCDYNHVYFSIVVERRGDIGAVCLASDSDSDSDHGLGLSPTSPIKRLGPRTESDIRGNICRKSLQFFWADRVRGKRSDRVRGLTSHARYQTLGPRTESVEWGLDIRAIE
ncbi:hypothetical protein LXL04_008450 [Taraxacum kok-saghyz]